VAFTVPVCGTLISEGQFGAVASDDYSDERNDEVSRSIILVARTIEQFERVERELARLERHRN
jgi:hypothetical protein